MERTNRKERHRDEPHVNPSWSKIRSIDKTKQTFFAPQQTVGQLV